MRLRVQELKALGDKLFTKKAPILSFWQDIALNFYPERADFTVQRTIGNEFASHLMTGEPALARREMANSLSAMLRPRGTDWFHIRTNNEQVNKDSDCLKWLDWASDIQYKFMYEKRARLTRATKEGDNDFVTFGQCVIRRDINKDVNGLVYRTFHLRDVAWLENYELEVDNIHRNWRLPARDFMNIFKHDSIHPKVKEAAEKEPDREFMCRHIVLPSVDYDRSTTPDEKRKGARLPFVSIHIDIENDHLLEEIGAHNTGYTIPRWQTVSGTQYAHSPATVIAIMDARMLQSINLTLLEAGQKSVDPPLVAASEVIQGGVNTFAGGITYVDYEYDEKTGEALRPLMIDRAGIPWGDQLEERKVKFIRDAFFLNQIALPEIQPDMTAYEVQKRWEEYIRQALPLFEPMEVEYNGELCEGTFDDLMRYRAFGDPNDMPAALRGQEIRFDFESPLQNAKARANSQAFLESANLLNVAAQLDPTAGRIFKVQEALKDALTGAQAPATWIATPEEIQAKAQAAAQQQQIAQLIGGVNAGAQTAQNVGNAASALQEAGIMPAGEGSGQGGGGGPQQTVAMPNPAPQGPPQQDLGQLLKAIQAPRRVTTDRTGRISGSTAMIGRPRKAATRR